MMNTFYASSCSKKVDDLYSIFAHLGSFILRTIAIKRLWVRFPVGPLSSDLGQPSFQYPYAVDKSSTGLAGWG